MVVWTNKPFPVVVDDSLCDFGADEILALHAAHSVSLFWDFARDCVPHYLLGVVDFVAENFHNNSIATIKRRKSKKKIH